MKPRRLVAPTGALLLALGGVWWAFPVGLQPWRSAGIVTAWAGTGLLVASIILMVREPRFAALLGGLDTMYRWHHRCGVLAYLFLLAHPLCLALADWSESPATAWAVISPWLESWPVWLGWAALIALMAGLATTFSVHLSYRCWRALHYLLGLAVVLGLAHIYVLLGNAGPFLVLIAVTSLALGWRFIGADLGLANHPYRVAQVENRTPQMIEFSLAPCATRLSVAPGQFVLAAFGQGPRFRGCGELHPFTVSAIRPDGVLNLSVKALGPCTTHLQDLEPGVRVGLQGPFGNFLDGSAQIPQLWVAGGVGITPFMAVLRQGSLGQPTTLIYLFRNAQEAAFLDELQTYAASEPRFELLTEASGDQLPDVDALLARVDRLGERQIQVCGPPGMVLEVKRRLKQRGIQSSSIHFESFDFR